MTDDGWYGMGAGLALKLGNANRAKAPTAIKFWLVPSTTLSGGLSLACARQDWVHRLPKIAEEPDVGKSACPVL